MKRQREGGFALLVVFLMASIVAINLYMQLPRAAFEAQRGREELLQQRGEEYIRAIQLYVAKWRRYPPDLDALQKTNNVRYLRKRYKDPMTGKDEWRAIHINAAGQLTDSIVQKQPGEEKKQYQNNFITEMPSMGAAPSTPADAGQNVALRRRPSDEGGAPMPGVAGSFPPDQQPGAQGNMQWVPPGNMQSDGQPNTPPNGQQPPVPGQTPQPSQPVQLDANGQPIFQGQQPGQPPAPGQPGQPNPFAQMSGQPGQMGQPQQPNQPQANNPAMPYPVPALPGAIVSQNPSMPPASPQQGRGGTAQGLDVINKILTTPRPNPGMQAPGAPGLQIGGGLAGFASMAETPSIKIYNERQKYNEWEFIYDMKKDKRLMGAAGAMGNQPGNPLGGANGGANPNVPNPLTGNPANNQAKPPINSFGAGSQNQPSSSRGR